MKIKKSVSLTLLAAVALTVNPAAGGPPVPATPAAVDKLVYARPFKLAEGYEYEWSKEKPRVTEGYLLVLKVDPDLVYPRQTAEPVLYVGLRPAERINAGYPSGHVVALVPGPVEKLDLSKERMWFGTPELPERIDLKTAKEEHARAVEAGVKPVGEAQTAAALARGREKLSVQDRYELLRAAAELIEQYAPDEAERAAGLRVPRAKATPAAPASPEPVTAEKH